MTLSSSCKIPNTRLGETWKQKETSWSERDLMAVVYRSPRKPKSSNVGHSLKPIDVSFPNSTMEADSRGVRRVSNSFPIRSCAPADSARLPASIVNCPLTSHAETHQTLPAALEQTPRRPARSVANCSLEVEVFAAASRQPEHAASVHCRID